MRRTINPLLGAVLALSTLTLVCFHELVRHPNDVLVGPQRHGWNDLTTYFIALHSYPRWCWDEYGQWPFWNPLRNTGVPHLGNPQTALFYPSNWLCWWLDPPNVLSWLLVVH